MMQAVIWKRDAFGRRVDVGTAPDLNAAKNVAGNRRVWIDYAGSTIYYDGKSEAANRTSEIGESRGMSVGEQEAPISSRRRVPKRRAESGSE